MNMKKIMATVAASALAVSAMATAAFADASEIVSVTTNAATSYTSATVTFKSVALNAGLAVATDAIVISGDTAALTITGAGAEEVKVNGFAKDGSADLTWNIVAAPAMGDKTGVTAGDKSLDVTVVYTFAETTNTADIKKALEGVFKADSASKLTIAYAGATADVNFKEATIAFNAVTTDTTENGAWGAQLKDANNYKGLSKTQKTALENGEATGAEVVIELKKAVEADAGLKFNVYFNQADSTFLFQKEVTIAKGETTATITLTAEEVIDAEFAGALAAMVGLQEDIKKDAKTVTYTIFGAEEAEEPSDETDATEDTEASLEGEETTAADGEVDGDADADASGDADSDADADADSKGENPGTGVALAIVPAIVAGAAVVASRKRK